jgi:hypothetical protein
MLPRSLAPYPFPLTESSHMRMSQKSKSLSKGSETPDKVLKEKGRLRNSYRLSGYAELQFTPDLPWRRTGKSGEFQIGKTQ